MDIQTIINGQMASLRQERLSQSEQLLLGELRLKLEAVEHKEKPIIFDFGMKPAGASSWRGSYQELGLEYSTAGGGEANWLKAGTEYDEEGFSLPESPTAQDFIAMLEAITGKTMIGYKGGEYVMHKNVAVYLGNYGSSSVDNYKGSEYATVAPVDVIEDENSVVIITASVEY